MIINKLNESEMLESLSRSGYLLESEITKQMVEYGFFVESNVSSLDPLTGKSRELDLIAEFDHPLDPDRLEKKVIAKIRFVFEIKNSNMPLILLTEYIYSPNSEIWEGIKVGSTTPNHLIDFFILDFFDVIFHKDNKKEMFTQYCSFSKKNNGELMAHHPENIYSSLSKITHFCEESIERWNNPDRKFNEDYFRKICYLPIILINEDLYELEIKEDNTHILNKVEYSRLIFNYHFKQENKTSIIHVVTKAGLKDFLIEMLKAEKEVEKNMIEAIEEFKKNSKHD